jgi:hypothetical protein
LKGAKVVAEITPLACGEIIVPKTGVTTEETVVDPIAVEQQRQEEWQGVTHRISLDSKLAKINFEALHLALVRDEFDTDMFDENVNTEQHVEKNDETASSESDEENMQPSVDTTPDAPVDTGGKGNEANVPPPPHRLLYVMYRHQIALTVIHIT